MKGKSKKILILSIISLIVILTIIFTITKVTNKTKNIDAEILRSMNYAQVTDEGKVENTDFVKFSAFFTRDLDGDENAEKLLGTCRNVNSTDQLYMDLNVLRNGYLKNGKITINSTNFNYSMSMVKDSVLKNNYISNNVKVIELNQVNAGTQKLILGDIHAYIGNDINNYSKISTITLTGTHVSDEGIETSINKTVEITVDWHGEVKAEFRGATVYYNYDELDTETVSFSFTLSEIQRELILKDNEAKVTIPELNGFAPTEVKCTNSNIESEYNTESKELKIKRTSTCNDNGIVTSTLSRSNTYTVQITYPKEAYDAISSYTTLTINAEGYYTGYNNPNEEFINPYESNKVKGKATIVFREKPKGSIYNFYVDFVDKKYVSDPLYRYIISKQYLLNLYDNYNIDIENTELEQENKTEIKNKEYVVRWQAVRGPQGVVPSMIMSETKVHTITDIPYGDKWDNEVMEEYVTNSGIYFEGVDNMLEDDGTISVYNNDTNELIHTFTKEEWNNYSRNNPYKYENSIKHIRVETSKTKLNTTLSVYNVKELELERVLKDFTKEQIKDLDMGYTYLTGICNIEGQNAGIANRIDSVKFISEKSNSKISIQTQKIPTQEILNNQKIYIDTIYNEGVIAKWKNGEFLIEIPKEIINMNINNISVNNSKVKISVYDLYKKDDRYFIKIITENEEPITSYRITIDCTMTPDPRVASSNKTIRLYDHNKYCNEYYNEIRDIYDVDSDNNTSELVGTASTSINLLSPTSLITLETITNYDDKKDDEITIAPNIAELTKETKEATINISLTNNYPNTVSGVQILGKIPFEGNTYVLNPNELGSEFTTTMKEQGIIIPEELKEKAVVYYSENENPDKNLDNNKNGWTLKENVQDFSKIKTYLIDLAQYTINVGTTYTFNYAINIQDKTNYNLASYSDHAVYYEYDTEGGKLQLSTEPNKVGIRITRRYKLELTKTKENFKNLGVPGATYKIEYIDIEGNNKTRILTTDSNGNINMDELYVGKTYKITEIRSPENYVLNNETIEFKVIEDEQGKLKVETTNEEKVTINQQEEKVIVKTEDEPKYNITITKTDESTGEALSDVRFRINGSMYTTNRDGQIILKRLIQNKEYTVVEEEAEGYYIPEESITFKLVKDNERNLKIESNSEAFNNATIQNTEEEDLIQVSNINITNEKIPTYNLQILKVEENLKEKDISKLMPLSNAKFKLIYQDLGIEKIFSTDINGNINIFDLYQYVDGKYITGNYILKEIQSPEGYSNNEELIKFRVTKNEEDKLYIQIENEEDLSSIKKTYIEEDTVKMIIQDKPLFTLTKTDAETGELLANAKFVIYETDTNKNIIGYAKDVNGNYVGEKSEKGEYVITTDESGTIVLPLKGGFYKIVEVEFPEGYQESINEEYFNLPGGEGPKINSIEDLVEFSNDINNGNNYSGITVKLMKSLDFNDASSYRDPNNLGSYILDPIGKSESCCFSGVFDGQGNEIKNFKKENQCIAYGLFGYVLDGKITDLGVSLSSHQTNDHRYMDQYAGGIAGYIKNSTIINCYSSGYMSYQGTVGGIVGYATDNSTIINCYHTGYLESRANGGGNYGGGSSKCGGIVGYLGNGSSVKSCYNNVYMCGASQNYIAGGIVAHIENSDILNCYNTSEIRVHLGGNTTIYNRTNGTIGGIAGKVVSSNINNCYNTGSIYNNNAEGDTNESGGIVGAHDNTSKINNCYRLNSKSIVGKTIDYSGIGISELNMKTKSFYNNLNRDGVWLFQEDLLPILNTLMYTEEITNINIKNMLKRFNITTEVEINSENARTGGTITGNYNDNYKQENNIKYIETVTYNNNSTKAIEIVPETGYYIDRITINNKQLDFTVDENGSVTLPEEYFKNVKENKHIVVKFEKNVGNNKLIICKVDQYNSNIKLPNAEFEMKLIRDFDIDNTKLLVMAGKENFSQEFKTWEDKDKRGYNVTLNTGTAQLDEEESLVLDGNTTWNINNWNNGSFGSYEIQVKIDKSFIPVKTDYWYAASCILGCELPYTQKDIGIIINKDGYFALGYNTSTIYSSNVYALDDEYHSITVVYERNNIKFAIDGEIITTIIYKSSGNEMTKLGVGWNADSTSTSIKGKIKKIKIYQESISDERIKQNHESSKKIELKTNEVGIAETDIYKGQYNLREIRAPEGYELLQQNIKVEITNEKDKRITVRNKKIIEAITINKKDKNTNNPIPNTKFVIYSLNEENEPVDFAKDYDNNYLGTEENGKYVLTTDENGQISVRPKPGLYKAIEIASADKYFLENEEFLRTIYFKVENQGIYYDESENQNETESDNTDLVINNIEDLVRFANAVNSGTSYEGKTIKLARTLDFNDNGSYSNSNDTSFGDYNEDGTIEGIKEELTKESVTGFKSIGIDELKPFKGTFNGNGHEISSIYIGYGSNSGVNGGVFGYIKDGKVLNLGVTSGDIRIGGTARGVIAGSIENGLIDNCYSNVNLYVGSGAAGIVYNVKNSNISNCYNTGNMSSGGNCAGIAVNVENSKISNCYNTGDISSGGYKAGIVTIAKDTTIINCHNTGNISSSAPVAGIAYSIQNTTISNCYNEGDVTASGNGAPAGGIVCYTNGNGNKIINSYNTGKVKTEGNAGGIVGSDVSNITINNCYNEGDIIAKQCAGGIAATIVKNNSIISNCYNTGKVSASESGPVGGIAMDIKDSKVTNCYNTGKIISGTAPAGGIAYSISNSKVSNCYNLGDIESNNVAGGIAQSISNNSKIINSYNRGNVTATYPAGGLSQSISNSEVINFYNTGVITAGSGVGGIVQSSSNSTMKNCYYLNTSTPQGIYQQDDIKGQVEAKKEEEMKDKNFAKLLNSNIKDIKSDNILIKWEYKKDSYPEVDKIRTDKEVTITNEKAGKVIVHHYLEGTGPENTEGRQPVLLADDEILKGRIEAEYTTSPNMNIEGYTLIKDEHGEYIVPENASGEFKEEEQHVYYYYSKKKLELTVHHYLEGTENKVPLGENEEGKELFAEDEYSEHNEGDHYKTTPSAEVLKTYELVGIVGDEEKDITQNEVVTYYYKIKKHEITTKVEVPEGRDEEEKGGSISGEGLKPYETVDYGKTSKEDIIVKPDENYRIKQIRLVSTNEEGAKQESIIYIEGKASEKEEQENAEITYKKNSDGSLTLTKFENMTEDKEVIVVFEKDAGKLIVHHYIEGTTEKIYDDQVTIGIIGAEVETSPVKVENYVVVQEPADRIGTITKQVQEKIYYYQRQYKVTTDIIKYEEPNEAGEMQEVIGGTISGKGESSYEDILKGRNNQKEIVITPNEGFQITKITINGQEFDYSELLEKNGNVVLPEQFFKNVDENKHIEVEFRRKTKVHVKYLEAVTKNVLAEEELIEGYVGKKFETERKNVPNYKIAEVGSSEGITNEAQEAVEPNGQMTKDEITIIYWYEKVPSGILVKHVEKVVTKKTNEETGKEEIKVTGVVLDEEVIKGYAGESKNTERRKLEGKYEGYVSAENLNSTEGINVAKDENEKQVTMKQDEVVEVIYWYEKAFKITTDVIEHEETKVNEETGKSETVKVKGGTISGEDETPYETVIRSNDSTKQIKIVPEEGYRIKQVKINGEEVFIKDKIAEDKTLTLTKENGYFKNIQEDKLIEVEFEKIPARVIVHYYLQGTGEEFENEPVILADEDIIIGTVNGKYITTPNMNIKGYTLIKDEKGEYIMPENKTGTLTEKDTHVYYYYTKDPVELIVHHYLEGTKDKVPLGKDEQGQNTFAEDEHYYYEEGEHYKTKPSEEVLKAYKLVKVVGDEEKDIMQNEEVIYYYQIKKYQITTRVEIPQEEIEAGRTEKGGNTSGEEEKPYETVEHGKTSKEDIIVTPKQGYKVKEIRLVSTKKEESNVGNNNEEDNSQGSNQGDNNQGSNNKEIKTESIIYINGTEKDKEEKENAEITYKENLDGSLILTKFENVTEDKEVIVVFEPVIGKVIVHHYVEGTKEKISEDEVTEDLVGTEVQTKPVEKENYVVVEEPKDKNTVITEDTQERIYYYQKQYKVTTNIIKYEEPDEDGKMKEVIGGTISGKGEKSYEDILKGRNNQKEIVITPKDGFEIVKITINGKEFDYSKLLKEDESVTLSKEFFKNVEENKHVEVEFRRKTKVHVKYLEVETKNVLADEITLEGYVGKDFETQRKNISNYKTAKLEVSNLGITNEKEEAIQPNGKMEKDEITIIYWYEKIPAGIIVKHVEKVTTKTINQETGKEEIKVTGVLLDEEEIKGYVGESKNTERRKLEGKFEGYIPAENKEATQGINVGKEENSKTVTLKENEVTEIIYWYEKEFKITTDVIEHKETVINPETGKEETKTVKGGTISGEDEKAYEKVIRSNNSTKEIKIVPEKGYKIKQILINDKEIIIDEKVAEDGSITLKAENGYFTNMQEDKHIKVEFEKIPAKVIVKYKDSYTKESIAKDKIITGNVGDKYNETRQDIKNYIPAEPELEPENSTGTMKEETIIITYWYTKEFKITTDVKEHEETVKNTQTGKEEKVKVKGGSITGEDAESYEVVTRGKTSTKEIIIKPENGYRIKVLTINGKEIETKDLVKEDNTIELPFFENMQEDKHIVVEFEKIPAKVIIKYLEEGTEKPIYKTEDGKEYEEIEGFINDKYETKEKEIEYYELVKEKYPKNSNGSMTEQEIEVKYYYKKLLFNMKIEKEIEKITLNGENVEVTNKNKQKLEIKYKDLKETNLEITYKIKVTNTEKVEGIAIIEEALPGGFEFVRKAEEGWKEKEGKYTLTTEVINPGETKEYEITLKWNPQEANKGQKVNTAKITNTVNIPKYEETSKEDNEDTAIIEIKLNKTIEDIINMPKTGQERIIYILSALIGGTCISIIVCRKKKSNKR